jgi:hypothetical protein
MRKKGAPVRHREEFGFVGLPPPAMMKTQVADVRMDPQAAVLFKIMKIPLFLSPLIPLLAITATLHAKSPFPENTPVPDLTRVVIQDTSHTYYLGPIGARGWIYKFGSYATPDDFEAYFCNDLARQILITSVEKGSPADGVLAPGDVILGTGGQPFAGNARRAIADAIDEAEREENGGKLRLLRWRPAAAEDAGASTRAEGRSETVTLQLRVMGTFSDTAPYDCPKSEAIVTATAREILKTGLKDKLHIAALGLLATGDEANIAAVREFIRASRIAAPDMKLTVEKPRGMASWDWSYAAVLLGEYHQLTGDRDVLPALETYAVHIAKGQAICGSWGHKMADLDYNNGRPNGRLTGYGTLNQPGLICLLAMVVAEKCGIRHPEITRAIGRAGDFYGYYAGKGCIPYGHGQPLEYMLANNGMSGSAAISFALNGETDRARFFARLSAAAHGKTEIGHTGPYFGAFLTPLGANVAGPETCAEFFKQHRWLHTLARKWDGGFVYQPPGGRWGGSSGKYYDMSSDGAYLMFYAAPRRQLLLTGRNSDPSLWLKGDEAKAAVHASLIDYGKLDNERLIGLLGHPVPAVRRMAADALGSREGDLVPSLTSMLANGSPEARIGACHALGACGAKAATAAPALLAVVGDPAADLWLRSRALTALRSIRPEPHATADALLRVVLAEKPADPRGDLDLEIANTLARLIDDPYAMSLDLELFHAAANKLLGNPHHAARTSAMRLLAKIPLGHFHAVSDRIVEVILNKNPDYQTYHSDAERAMGLSILEGLGIRDGIELAMATIETDKWGQHVRVYGPRGRLALLAKYGSASHSVLPELRAMRESGKLGEAADARLKAIAEATDKRELITLEEATRISRGTLE